MYGPGPVPFNDGCAAASMDMSSEYGVILLTSKRPKVRCKWDDGQGLSPTYSHLVSARLKSCRDTKPSSVAGSKFLSAFSKIQTPGLKPQIYLPSVSAGLKARFPGLKSGASTKGHGSSRALQEVQTGQVR
jgi:hypothetical protein